MALLFLSGTNIRAQEKCKYDINKTDPMTGKLNRVINTPIKLFALFQTVGSWAIQLERLGDEYSIRNRFALGTNTSESIEKGDSLILKLESGTLITVYAKNRVAPKILNKPNEDPVIYFESLSPISIENFKLLSTEKVLFVRTNVGPLVFDHEIKDKAAVKLKQAANCILQ